MPVFPSSEWMQEFSSQLRAHPRAGEVARGLDGVYRFVVEPAGPVRSRQTYDVEIRPSDGGALVQSLDGDDAEPRLTLTAGYDRWRQLIRGELDITLAVMLRRLKLSGDVAGIRRDITSAGPLVDALRGVDTSWPDGG